MNQHLWGKIKEGIQNWVHVWYIFGLLAPLAEKSLKVRIQLLDMLDKYFDLCTRLSMMYKKPQSSAGVVVSVYWYHDVLEMPITMLQSVAKIKPIKKQRLQDDGCNIPLLEAQHRNQWF